MSDSLCVNCAAPLPRKNGTASLLCPACREMMARPMEMMAGSVPAPAFEASSNWQLDSDPAGLSGYAVPLSSPTPMYESPVFPQSSIDTTSLPSFSPPEFADSVLSGMTGQATPPMQMEEAEPPALPVAIPVETTANTAHSAKAKIPARRVPVTPVADSPVATYDVTLPDFVRPPDINHPSPPIPPVDSRTSHRPPSFPSRRAKPNDSRDTAPTWEEAVARAWLHPKLALGISFGILFLAHAVERKSAFDRVIGDTIGSLFGNAVFTLFIIGAWTVIRYVQRQSEGEEQAEAFGNQLPTFILNRAPLVFLGLSVFKGLGMLF